MQITARSDRDLTSDGIIQKVSDSSGSKYSGAGGGPPPNSRPAPSMSSKPAFTPTRSSGGGGAFNPLDSVPNPRANAPIDANVDDDGWGQDAPPVTRSQLEKVQSAYQPTKVNMRELSLQKPEPSRFNGTLQKDSPPQSDVIKGGYQPVGKVDISALRRQAQESSAAHDDRPTAVKGSYEPVGKVDIAAIRARAHGPTGGSITSSGSVSSVNTGTSTHSNEYDQGQNFPADRSAPASTSERLTSMPKPKVSNRYGSSASNFSGTKAPTPVGFGLDSKPAPNLPPVGVGRTFAERSGKTPAQIWAEKKARERGLSGTSDSPSSAAFGAPASPIVNQTTGEWKSGYAGKSWAPVQTTKTGQSASSLEQQRTGDEEHEEEMPASPAGGIGAIRDRFKNAAPMGASAPVSGPSASSPPPLDTSTKPNASRGVPIPGLPTRPSQPSYQDVKDEGTRLPTPPPQPPRSPTPPTPTATGSTSPIRLAMPVSRGAETEIEDARHEQISPPPAMPVRSLAQALPHDETPAEELDEPTYDPARATAAATAAISAEPEHATQPAASQGGRRALVIYDYEIAEDNELPLKEGEYITNIDMVDTDWWMGQNSQGETGLFPNTYVELVEEESSTDTATVHAPATSDATSSAGRHGTAATTTGPIATALYDYEAAEDNELSFPEGGKITGLVSLVSFLGKKQY